MRDNDLTKDRVAAQSIGADIEVAGIAAEHTAGLKHDDASSKVAIVSDELYRPKRFYHRMLLSLFIRISGKFHAQLRREFSWHYFVTRSTMRAYWRTLFSTP